MLLALSEAEVLAWGFIPRLASKDLAMPIDKPIVRTRSIVIDCWA